MLEGTDISSAYSPIMDSGLSSTYGGGSSQDLSYDALIPQDIQMPPQKKSQPIPQLKLQPAQQRPAIDLLPASNPINQQLAQAQQQQMIQKPQAPSFDSSSFNKQFDMNQDVMRRRLAAQAQQQQMYQNHMAYMPMHEDTYWDKLANKKKEIWKFFQSGLIILLAISIHFLIDFLLRHYLENHEISFERELMIRMLYPLAVVFLAWNIIAHMK